MAGLDSTVRSVLSGAPELLYNPTTAVGIAAAVQGDPTGTLDPAVAAQAVSSASAHLGVQQGQADIGLTASGPDDVSAPDQTQQQPQQPHKKHHSLLGSIAGGIVGDIIHPAEHAVGSAAGATVNLLSSGIEAMQHAYRAEHDLVARYGVVGLLDSLSPFDFSNDLHKASQQAWQNTANGEMYRDGSGYKVSPGRDLARLIGYLGTGGQGGYGHDANGNLTGHGANVISGLGDITFDFAFDPFLKAGKVSKLIKARGIAVGGRVVDLSTDPTVRARQLRELSESDQPVAFTQNADQAVVGRRVLVQGRAVRPLVSFDGVRASNVFDIYRNNAAAQAGFDKVARMSTEDVIKNYPSLRPLAKELGAADTGEKVAQVFHDAITVRNYRFAETGLPATGITRRTLEQHFGDFRTIPGLASDALDRLDAFAKGAKAKHIPMPNPTTAFNYRPFTLDSRTLQISGREFDPEDPAAIEGIRNVLLYSQSRKVANAVVAEYMNAPSLAEKVNIVTKAFRDTLRAAGVPDESDMMARWNKDIDFLTKHNMRPIYGLDENGLPVRALDPETGEPLSLGLFNNQTGKLAFPQFNDMRAAINEYRSNLDPRKIGFKADDWIHDHYTSRIFKNLVLLSLGFGLRVSAGELAPAWLVHSPKELLGGGLAAASAKLNPTLFDLAAEHPEGLKGFTVQTKRGLGTIKAIEGDEAKTVKVAYNDGTEFDHPAHQVTVMHRPINDREILDHAHDIGMRISGDEIPHYKAAISKALWGVSHALLDEDYRRQAAFNVMTLGGHTVAPGLTSNHDVYESGAGRTEDLREYMRQAGARDVRKPQRMKDEFTTYDSENTNHPMFWHFAIHEAAKDPGVQKGAQAYLEALSNGASKEEASQAFVRADSEWMNGDSDLAKHFRAKMALYGHGAEEYSKLRAAATRGLVYGKNGEVNLDVLQGIAGHADIPNVGALADREHAFRPLAVKGRVLEDIPKVNGFERFSAWGWRRALHPTINTLSRAPIYTVKTTQEYKFLKPWVDAGIMPEAEARQIAQVRGANAMLPLIHNTKLRSQMSDIFRNVVPFYFAQEQAYKRYGRNMAKDPVAFQKAILAAHGIGNSGVLREDDAGQKHVVLPGTGVFSALFMKGAQALGLPVQGGLPSIISGNTISLKTVVPEGELPSVSPLVAVSLKHIQSMFPESEPLIHAVIGDIAESQSDRDALIPNATLKRIYQGMAASDRDPAFATAYMHSIAWAFHRADELRAKADALPASDPNKARLEKQADRLMPGPNANDYDRQQALDRLKNATRILTFVKAAVGAASPLSPALEVGDVKLRAELATEIKQKGIANGVQSFLEKHPNATADTVFLSDNSATNTALPATSEALDWIQENRVWAQRNPLAAAYLIPQSPGKYDQEAYNQELALGLRARKSPEQMVRALYAAATNSVFFRDLAVYDKMKEQYANDPQRLSIVRQQWTDYTRDLANANPVWYAELNNADKGMVARQAYTQITAALKDPTTPQSPQTEVISGLVKDYQDYLAALAHARQPGTSLTVSSVEDAWKSYLDDEATKDPLAAAFIHGVLRRLSNG